MSFQKEPAEFRMYDDDSAAVSGSADSDGSEMEETEEGSELQKGLLCKSERGPLGQLQPQSGMGELYQLCYSFNHDGF